MLTVRLGASELRSSVLGFGCAALMGRASRKDSLRALHAAFDSGITFFDTARSYGYGESEGLLGEFLLGRRERVVISTKFGILAARQPLWKKTARVFARKLFQLAPAARKAATAQIAAQFSHNQFSAETLRHSLDESLRQLRTDYVDLLFMHSPPASVLQQEDLFGELEKLTAEGKVRIAGISASPELAASQAVRKRQVLKALQIPVNLFNIHQMGADYRDLSGQRILVANLPFGGGAGITASRNRIREVAALRGIAPELARKLTVDDEGLLADVALNLILGDTGIHTVVPSMIRLPHLHANVNAIVNSRFSSEEIAYLRREFSRINTETESMTTAGGQ
jgi:aryl-alcohol dehydrogenase-like predicted oxidoreductase